MNRIKKHISAILAAAMVLSLAGCNSAENSSAPESSNTTTSNPTSGATSVPETEPSVTEKPESGTTGAGDSVSTDTPETTATTAVSDPVSSDVPAVTAPVSPETPAETAAATTAKPVSTTAAKPADTKPAVTTTYGPTDIGGRPKDEITDKVYDDVAEFEDVCGIAEAPMDFAAAGGTDGGIYGFEYIECGPGIIECPIYPDVPQIQPEAGLLTGGEWRDNVHWSDWLELYTKRDDWSGYHDDWRIQYNDRIAVRVTSNGEPVQGAKVSCASAIGSAVTDNKGMAYLFYPGIDGPTEPVIAEFDGTTAQVDGVIGNGKVEIELGDVQTRAEKKLDFMIMCDTTGSMSDELEYLKEELQDIIRRVKQDNSNIPVRLSVNFYRDEGDDYIVREYPFTDDIEMACDAVGEQYAAGGGDTPEAVHTALDSALNNHDWDEDAVKIMFIVLDAPPHYDPQIIDSVNGYIKQAAEMGVRIVPIASSGVDKSTEFLLRNMAFVTGGTYTFLTDDSGVGYGHVEPTVGAYNVEKLNDMMVRIVDGYLS